jgi:LacI family transcriptional regulator
MKRKTKVTMNDIARAAGVSQATVSLVLNQSRNIKLSDDTRQRVINVATELGYDRLPAVHAPRNQEEIALLVSSMQSFDPFIDAISQAREAAWRNETLLTVYDYGDDIELALNIIRQLEKRNCIGIILASGHHAGGHDGVPGLHPHPAGAAQPARPRLAAAAVVYPGRLRQRLPGD